MFRLPVGPGDMTVYVIAGIAYALLAVAVSYLTAKWRLNSELRKEYLKRALETEETQKYRYIYPFRHSATEFRRRIEHICIRLGKDEKDKNKQDNMIKRFQHEIDEKKNLDWYFSDDIGPDGGYYISSTIYMTCVMFYWMMRIQREYPFIPLQRQKTIPTTGVRFEVDSHPGIDRKKPLSATVAGILPLDCDVYDFIGEIKQIISGNRGISYGVIDSLGDYLFDHDKDRLINYAEFADLLLSDESRPKFVPIIRFWCGLCNKKGKVDPVRFEKLRALSQIIDDFEDTEVKPGLFGKRGL